MQLTITINNAYRIKLRNIQLLDRCYPFVHRIWFWLILIIRMLFRTAVKKEVKQDIRSESEDEEEWYEDAQAMREKLD